MDRSKEVEEINDGNFPGSNRTKCVKMPVNGQGTFTFNISKKDPFVIVVRDFKDQPNGDRIWLEIHKDRVSFKMLFDKNESTLKEITNPRWGLVEGEKISYWLSYDRDRMTLKYGKGYYMEQTTRLKYDFLEGIQDTDKIREKYYDLFNAEDMKVVELYRYHVPQPSRHGATVRAAGLLSLPPDPTSRQDVEGPVAIDRNPLVVNLPPVVLECEKVSLFALDSSEYMFAGSLPAACKELYDNIRNCELDWPIDVSDVLLSDAIRYSINTPRCILFEKLEEKRNEFGEPNETYLRVTLGQSFGNSPGIPYVLEIWPSKHYSPIHNHGGANAVIKVLHGSINITCYNKRVKSVDGRVLLDFDAKKEEITWINKNWYQTHKLENKSEDFCATIQCYSYALDDPIHWPFFDYVQDGTFRNQFHPDSDFTFREMREKVMEELRESEGKSNEEMGEERVGSNEERVGMTEGERVRRVAEEGVSRPEIKRKREGEKGGRKKSKKN